MGKDSYRHGGGSGKPLGGGAAGSGPRDVKGAGDAGGRDYYRSLGVNKTYTAGNISKSYHTHPEKNPQGNKEAERRFEQSSRSYKVGVTS